MAKYRKVSPQIWNDAKFRAMSDSGKLAFLFVLTHPHMTALGAMRATIDGLAAELGWSAEAFREAFAEASSKGMAKYDAEACLVWLPNYLRYNGPESPNVVKAWSAAPDLLPECELKTEVLQQVKAFVDGLSEGFREALPEGFREAWAKAMPNLKLKLEPKPELQQEEIPPESLAADAACPSDLLTLEREIVGLWNATSGVVHNQGDGLTEARRRAFRARVKSREWFEQFRAALSKFPLKCTVNDPKGWRPDMDWILKPDSVQRILEGKYDWSKAQGRPDRQRDGGDLSFIITEDEQ